MEDPGQVVSVSEDAKWQEEAELEGRDCCLSDGHGGDEEEKRSSGYVTKGKEETM